MLVSCDVAPVQFFLLARRSSVNPRGRRRGVAVHLFSLRRRRRLLLLRRSAMLYLCLLPTTDAATAPPQQPQRTTLTRTARPLLFVLLYSSPDVSEKVNHFGLLRPLPLSACYLPLSPCPPSTALAGWPQPCSFLKMMPSSSLRLL